MNWQKQANCIGQDQADWCIPPHRNNKWNPKHHTAVVKAISRCHTCPVRQECADEAIQEMRDGVSGGLFRWYPRAANRQAWALHNGTLTGADPN